VDVPVTSLCHVWVADEAKLADIEYTATWKEQPAEVSLSGFGTRTLHLEAGGAAHPGATGTVTVGVAGAQPVPATLRVVVGAAPPPTVAPVTVDGVIAGRTASVDVARYVDSPLHDKVISIVSVGKVSGLGARTPATSGSQVTLSPTPDAHGTEVFQVTVTDVTDRTRTERQAVGRITLHVLGVPDPPARVAPGRNVLSHQVTLTWEAPANNGEPIDFYEVSWSGGTHRCAASPCTITGLSNGVPYVFTVRAHNAVGFGRPSAPSRPAAEPNTVPRAPTGLTTSDAQDGRLQIAWQPAKVDGTPVLRYLVTYPGHSLSTAGTSLVAVGLDNDAPTTFTVYAINKQGRGPGASVKGQSAGVPQYPPPPAQAQTLPAPTLDTTQAGDHQVVRVSWNAVDPNGPKPVTYTLTRRATGRDPVVVCAGVRGTSCSDPDVTNDGSQVSYGYVATNGAGHGSPPSDSASFVARGTPEGISGFHAEGSGRDNQVDLEFDVQPVRDRSSTVYCTIDAPDGPSCGVFHYDGPGGRSNVDETVNVGRDGSVTVFLKECNTVATCAAPVSASTVAYGPLGAPQITNARASGPNVDFEVHWNPRGGAVQLHVTVQARGGGPIYDRVFDESDVANGDHQLAFTDAVDSTVGTPISLDANPLGRSVTITAVLTDASSLPRPGSTTDSADVFMPAGVHATLGKVQGDCTSNDPPACGHVTLTLANFQHDGSVHCHFDVQGGAGLPDIDVPTAADGSGTWQSTGKYTDNGAQITVTCESITDRINW